MNVERENQEYIEGKENVENQASDASAEFAEEMNNALEKGDIRSLLSLTPKEMEEVKKALGPSPVEPDKDDYEDVGELIKAKDELDKEWEYWNNEFKDLSKEEWKARKKRAREILGMKEKEEE